MSIKRMSAVWDKSKHGGSALLLLLALADYADDNGLCWPGHRVLSSKTRLHRRNVIRIMDRIAETGEVWVMNRKGQRSNLYVVTPGLNMGQLMTSIERAWEMGALSTRGGGELSLPPQVLGVVAQRHLSEPILLASGGVAPPGGITAPLRGGASTPDPSLSVIDPEGEDLWKPVLDDLKLQMTTATFNTWLLGSELKEEGGGLWRVEVQHRQAVDWLNNRLMPSVLRTVQRHEPGVQAVEFVAREAAGGA